MQNNNQNINTDRVDTTEAERSGAQAGQTLRDNAKTVQTKVNQTKDQAMAQVDTVPGQVAQVGRQAQAQANEFIQNAQAKLDATLKSFLHGTNSDTTATTSSAQGTSGL